MYERQHRKELAQCRENNVLVEPWLPKCDVHLSVCDYVRNIDNSLLQQMCFLSQRVICRLNSQIAVVSLHNFFLFFNYSLYRVLFCISFRCTAKWLENHVLNRVDPRCFKSPPGATPVYHSIIDYIPSAATHISATVL